MQSLSTDHLTLTVSKVSASALSAASAQIKDGGIHALVGPADCGKDAFVKVLCGELTPESGSLLLNNGLLTLSSALEARNAGIERLSAHLQIVSGLTALENLIVGDKRFSHVSHGVLLDEANRQLENFGLSIDLRKQVNRMSESELRRLEFFKLIWRNTRVIILDEWTLTLPENEAQSILRVAEQLAATGHIVILNTSRPAEISEFASSMTLFKDGEVVGQMSAKQSMANVELYLSGGGTASEQEPPVVTRYAEAMRSGAIQPIASVALAAGVTILSLYAMGKQPGPLFLKTLTCAFGGHWPIGQMMSATIPIALCAFATAIGSRFRLINLGAQGQMLIGSAAATAIALLVPNLPPTALLALMFFGACCGGALWGGLAIAARQALRINEAVASLLLSGAATALVAYLTSGPWHDASSLTVDRTAILPIAAHLPVTNVTRTPAEILLLVVATVLVGLILRSKARGQVQVETDGAKAGSWDARSAGAFAVAGCIAAVAGFWQVSAIDNQLHCARVPEVGILGIAAFIVGRGKPFSMAVMSLAFACNMVATEGLHLTDGLPMGAAYLIPGLACLFMLIMDAVGARPSEPQPAEGKPQVAAKHVSELQRV